MGSLSAAVQHPRRKCTLAASCPAPLAPSVARNRPDPILMHDDVIEIAQAILCAFERREELVPAFEYLLAREEGGEELRCVTHLLGLDAQLVTVPRTELGEDRKSVV